MAKQIDSCHIEELQYSLNLVQYWIEKTDTKVSISLGLIPFLTPFIEYVNSVVVRKENYPIIDFWMHIIEVVCLSCAFASIICFMFALKPNLKSGGNKNEKKKYLLYYGDIQRVSLDSYKDMFRKATNEDRANEIMNEIYMNSVICNNKMVKYKMGIILSIASIVGQFIRFCVYVVF